MHRPGNGPVTLGAGIANARGLRGRGGLWRCVTGVRGLDLHRNGHLQAAPRHGADHALRLAVIAHGLSGRGDAGRDGGFGHDPPLPDRLDHLVPRHQPVGMAEQQQKQVEDLRLYRHRIARAHQQVAVGVQKAAVEAIDHDRIWPRIGVTGKRAEILGVSRGKLRESSA
jgi:hypothetical protein